MLNNFSAYPATYNVLSSMDTPGEPEGLVSTVDPWVKVFDHISPLRI